jgi:hypothetical protein
MAVSSVRALKAHLDDWTMHVKLGTFKDEMRQFNFGKQQNRFSVVERAGQGPCKSALASVTANGWLRVWQFSTRPATGTGHWR